MNMYIHYFKKGDVFHINIDNIIKEQYDVTKYDKDVIYRYCMNIGMKIFTEELKNGHFSDDEIMNHL